MTKLTPFVCLVTMGLVVTPVRAGDVLDFGNKVPTLEELRAAFGTSRALEWETPQPPQQAGTPTKPATSDAAEPSNTPRDQTPQVEETGISIAIEFEKNKASVQPDFLPHISQIAALMAENPNMRLRIVGHTDASGSESYNESLSFNRARAVMQHLIYGHSVQTNRLIAEGRGEYQPRYEDRMDPRNRRVEFFAVR